MQHPIWTRLAAAVLFGWAALSPAAGRCGRPDQEFSTQVDRLFSEWDREDCPGAVAAVVWNGRVLHRKAYGMANLEWGVPNSPRTVFCVGSVSKQFTGYAAALLVAQGRLRLEDDYRTHIPEMPDYGRRITIGDLVHHTSGLRDDQMLLYLGDWEQGELHGAGAVIERILARQRGVLFEPGRLFDYSNTNYLLLGEIVRRVSGRSLREFARLHVFEPLGMMSTFFLDDYREIVRQRAWSYVPNPGGGYRAYVDTHDQVGAGGVHTTIGDMIAWAAHLDAPGPEREEVARLVQTPGRLRGGESTGYGFGLEIDVFRGLRVVRHDGSYGGYRAMILRFPDERFTVVCLANAGDMDVRSLGYRISRIFLGERMTSGAADSRPIIPLPPGGLSRWAGDYLGLRSADLLTASVSGAGLLCIMNEAQKVEYGPVSPEEFRPLTPGYPVSLKFEAGEGGRPSRVGAYQGGKLLQTYERIKRAAPSSGDLRAFEGLYDSPEIEGPYRFEVVDGRLFVRSKRAPRSDLRPLQKDQFAAWPLLFDFERDQTGAVRGFRLGRIGPEGIPFRRRPEAPSKSRPR